MFIAAHKAFSDNWLGNIHHLFADLMDGLHKSTEGRAYNQTISIIQSSGFGKSTLVNKVAEIKFCFPFNIREAGFDPHGESS
jgi:hypothetical protein